MTNVARTQDRPPPASQGGSGGPLLQYAVGVAPNTCTGWPGTEKSALTLSPAWTGTRLLSSTLPLACVQRTRTWFSPCPTWPP